MNRRTLVAATCLILAWPAACDNKRRRPSSDDRAARMVGRQVKGGGDFDGLYVETKPYMGTVFRIIVALNPHVPDIQAERARASTAVQAAFRAVADIESSMSDHIPGSQVARLNRRARQALDAGRAITEPLAVHADVMAVLQEALQVSKLTSGAFDISYAALKIPWGMKGDGPHRVPTRAEIAKALPFVGYKGIRLDPQNNQVQLKAGMRIDLGGVAKGYALDIASKVLKDAGFPNHIVYGGGDLNVSGRRPDRAWRLGIQDPGRRGDYFAVLSLSNMAVVTSGDYERYFVDRGRRYAHIIDPRTGRPARGLHSVTVIADRAVYADAMATGLFVLGLPRAKSLVERISGTEALFVTDKGRVVVTSGLVGKVEILHLPTVNSQRNKTGTIGKPLMGMSPRTRDRGLQRDEERGRPSGRAAAARLRPAMSYGMSATGGAGRTGPASESRRTSGSSDDSLHSPRSRPTSRMDPRAR